MGSYHRAVDFVGVIDAMRKKMKKMKVKVKVKGRSTPLVRTAQIKCSTTLGGGSSTL